MSEANPKADLLSIFNQIDKDQDGFISRADLEASGYAASIFENNQNALMAFNVLHNKMNHKQFALLANGYTYKLHDLAIAKFQLTKNFAKYLSVSSQSEAAPSIKQSYIKLCAHTQQYLSSKQHMIGIEIGIDKLRQQSKIKELTQVLGHAPHEVFLLFKLKTNSSGQEIAVTLQSLLDNAVSMAKEMAPDFQLYFNAVRINSKYFQGYIYIIIQIDNAFVDNVTSFAAQIIQSISPDFCLKFKANLKSNLKHLLKESFDLTKSGGEIDIQFDIDNATLRKIKQLLGDNLGVDQPDTYHHKGIILLLEEVKCSMKFNNLGQALMQFLNIQPEELPKPIHMLSGIKEINVKQLLGQFFEQVPSLIDKIKDNCQFQGQLSLNLEDIFVKLSFDLQIQEAFDLL